LEIKCSEDYPIGLICWQQLVQQQVRVISSAQVICLKNNW
jgi:hypothetical protein